MFFNRKLAVFILVFGLTLIASSAFASTVKNFKPFEEGVSYSELRDQAVRETFAQALFLEMGHMVPESLSMQKNEALKKVFGQRYEQLITGYKDMKVHQDVDGISVSVNVTINRNALRMELHKLGVFSMLSSYKPVTISVNHEKVELTEEQSLELDDKVKYLCELYSLQNATVDENVDGRSNLPDFSVKQLSSKRWTAELSSDKGRWYASGSTISSVWSNLWERYYGSEQIDYLKNPKVVIEVSGWFNPEGVKGFTKKLESWYSAVQNVKLLNVKMQPTVVSAKWSVEILDQWILKSYLNDYLPARGLKFKLQGLQDE